MATPTHTFPTAAAVRKALLAAAPTLTGIRVRTVEFTDLGYGGFRFAISADWTPETWTATDSIFVGTNAFRRSA